MCIPEEEQRLGQHIQKGMEIIIKQAYLKELALILALKAQLCLLIFLPQKDQHWSLQFYFLQAKDEKQFQGCPIQQVVLITQASLIVLPDMRGITCWSYSGESEADQYPLKKKKRPLNRGASNNSNNSARAVTRIENVGCENLCSYMKSWQWWWDSCTVGWGSGTMFGSPTLAHVSNITLYVKQSKKPTSTSGQRCVVQGTWNLQAMNEITESFKEETKVQSWGKRLTHRPPTIKPDWGRREMAVCWEHFKRSEVDEKKERNWWGLRGRGEGSILPAQRKLKTTT